MSKKYLGVSECGRFDLWRVKRHNHNYVRSVPVAMAQTGDDKPNSKAKFKKTRVTRRESARTVRKSLLEKELQAQSNERRPASRLERESIMSNFLEENRYSYSFIHVGQQVREREPLTPFEEKARFTKRMIDAQHKNDLAKAIANRKPRLIKKHKPD